MIHRTCGAKQTTLSLGIASRRHLDERRMPPHLALATLRGLAPIWVYALCFMLYALHFTIYALRFMLYAVCFIIYAF